MSIDIGISPSTNGFTADSNSNKFITPVKPIDGFSKRFHNIIDRFEQNKSSKLSIAVVGGGAGGVELTFAIHQRLENAFVNKNLDLNKLKIVIFNRSNSLLQNHNQ